MILERNTFIQKVREDKKDFIESEIGDIKSDKFFPQVKVKRFDNEYNLSIRYKHNEKGKETFEEVDGKVIWKKGNKEARFYEIDGAHEFEVIFSEKPETNIVEFTLQTKGVDFHYQGELTEQELIEGRERPENVVGSYAVYASSKRINYKGGKVYGSGKIGHIFRPKIIDNDGKEVWGSLDIDTEKGILKVTIPEEFLETCSYPIIVDPTIGYDTAGGSSLDVGSSINAFCSLYNTLSAVTGDTITSFSFYARKLAANETVTIAAYNISGGVPVSKLSTEQTVTVNSTTPQWWNSSTVSQSLTNGSVYGIAYGSWGGGVGTENTRIYYDSSSGNNVSYNSATSLPATWSHSAYYSDHLSIYATFSRAPIDIAYSYKIFIDKGKL